MTRTDSSRVMRKRRVFAFAICRLLFLFAVSATYFMFFFA